jgi:hypothetical protein
LEAAGAIRREAEPNRAGTLFRVLLPEEIEVCRLAREARAAALPAPAIDEVREADYYNVGKIELRSTNGTTITAGIAKSSSLVSQQRSATCTPWHKVATTHWITS